MNSTSSAWLILRSTFYNVFDYFYEIIEDSNYKKNLQYSSTESLKLVYNEK